MDTPARLLSWRRLPWLAAFVLLCSAQLALAQQPAAEADPPERVGHVSYRQGNVVFAPEGDEEWVELPQNRPLTAGDRLWSDRGARAEVHLGSATLHVDGESHVGVSALDAGNAQFILMQGTVNARVRELVPGENFEVDTPHLAFRATQPGDYRVEVDPAGHTRVVVHSGRGTVFGEGGQSVTLGAGQQGAFGGRFLAPAQAQAWRGDDFSQWAAARNRAEDQSVSARYVPRGVVGYQQLDAHGTWGQDAEHGAVWYPNVQAQDWAPYRHGRWTWVDPWGWTWVDDAPWGFAPFHYGRWATIGNRWAWVPGRLAPRPVYSPGLVVFMGGNGVDLGVGAGPSVGWYPLAPGEAWWPTYRASPRYVGGLNFAINLGRYPRNYENHHHRRHFHGVTVVREDDFRRGRHIRDHWRNGQQGNFNRGRMGFVPDRPDFRDRRGDRDVRVLPPRLQAPAPRVERRFDRDQYVRPAQGEPRRFQDRDGDRRDNWRPGDRERAERERERAERERERAERERADRGRPDWNRGDRDRIGDGRDNRDGRDGRDSNRDGRDRDGRDGRDGNRDARERAERAERAEREQAQAQRDRARVERDQERDRAQDQAVRDQARAQREQQRLQRDAEEAAREQQRDAARQRLTQQPSRQEPAPIGRQPARAERPDRVERPAQIERPARPAERPERAERPQQRADRLRDEEVRGLRGLRGDETRSGGRN